MNSSDIVGLSVAIGIKLKTLELCKRKFGWNPSCG